MSEIFKLSDIKAGYLLQMKDLDDGEVYNVTVVPSRRDEPPKLIRKLIALLDFNDPTRGHKPGDLACANAEGTRYWPASLIDDQLCIKTRGGNEEVIAVYGYTYNKFLLANTTEGRELLWQREAEKAEEPADPVAFSPEAFCDIMQDLIEDNDTEVAHSKMDALLCHQLRALGYGEGVKVFEGAEKWYA